MRKIDLKYCYTFDFECTTKEPAEVWLGCFTRLDKPHKAFTHLVRNIDDAIKFIFKPRKKVTTFLAHNLSYDLDFIICWLHNNVPEEEFSITDVIATPLTKKFFTATIIYNGAKIKFIDTYVKFTAPLKSVLESYTDDMVKGETPIYEELKDVVHSAYNDEYCKTDSAGLAKAYIKRLEFGTGSLTTASDAFNTFKEMYISRWGKQKFSRNFSPLDVELDDKLRPAYKGGFTFAKPSITNQIVKNVRVIDVNSMYPFNMYDKLLPYGKPFEVEGEVKTNSTYMLGVQKFIIDYCEIKDGYAPFITSTSSFGGSNIYESVLTSNIPAEKRTFTMTLQEFEWFKQSYHYEGMILLGGFLFKATTDTFNEYIDKFWSMKENPNPTIKNNGKLMLNSLYGKMAEGYLKPSFNVGYDNGVKLIEVDKEIKPSGYLPIAIFITSYSRVQLLKSIHKVGYGRFLYCDTDSIHYIENPDDKDPDLIFHKKDIGAWDKEAFFTEAKYIKAKRYIGKYNDKDSNPCLKIVCAGIKKKSLEEQIKSIDEFVVGKSIKTFQFKHGSTGMYVKEVNIKI